MHITVIIPVYNAARFLAEAIESVLIQQEVDEIILVEDGSQDNSLEICRAYASSQSRIRLIQHASGENKGAGASRNLGMQHAQGEYIAFLDADDKYLPNRFAETSKAFYTHPDADGVYETVGTLYEEHGLSPDTLKRTGIEQARIATISPTKLFRILAIAKEGYIHLDGMVIKRSALDETLMFDPEFKQCQDSDFLFRWSAAKQLYGISPEREVALRRVHDQNRVFNLDETLHYRFLCMRKCAIHQFYGSNNSDANWQILNRMARATKLVAKAKRLGLPVSPVRYAVIFTFLMRHPGLVKFLLDTNR